MTRTHFSTGKVIAFAVAIAVALLALVPGAWGPALAQTAGTPTPSPTATATATTVPAGASATVVAAPNKTVSIPAGAVPVEATVTFQPAADVESDPTSAASQTVVASALLALDVPIPAEVQSGGGVIASVFVLEALDADGNEISFDEPVTMTFDLTPEILAAAGGDANNVVLQFFDEDTGQWTPVSCTGSGTTLTCELPHFSVWALVIQTGDDAAPPQEGTATATPATTPGPAATGSGVFGSEDGSNMGLLLAGIVAVVVLGGAGARLAVRRSRV